MIRMPLISRGRKTNHIARSAENFVFASCFLEAATTLAGFRPPVVRCSPRRFQFQYPAVYTMVIRALGSLEGTATALDPSFKVLASAYPFVVGRLLADPTPEVSRVPRDEARQRKPDPKRARVVSGILEL